MLGCEGEVVARWDEVRENVRMLGALMAGVLEVVVMVGAEIGVVSVV